MEHPWEEGSGDKDMDSSSPRLASTKKRISPPISWGLGLANRDSFKTIRVILLGQSGVGKSGERSAVLILTVEDKA